VILIFSLISCVTVCHILPVVIHVSRFFFCSFSGVIAVLMLLIKVKHNRLKFETW
jgi:hypothetical protein